MASGRKFRTRVGQFFLFGNVALVGCLTFDLFSDASLHFLRPFDDGMHLWVTTHVPQASRDFLFDKALSDVGIVSVLVSWFLVDGAESEAPDFLAELRHRLRPSNLKLGAAVLGVEALASVAKDVFRRPRPRLDFESFSFPSGHTLAAVTLGGMFLFFRLYPFLKRRRLGQTLPEWLPLRWTLLGGWLVIGGMTAVGRIGADAHWLSDTLAAGAIGASTVTAVWLMTRKTDAA